LVEVVHTLYSQNNYYRIQSAKLPVSKSNTLQSEHAMATDRVLTTNTLTLVNYP